MLALPDRCTWMALDGDLPNLIVSVGPLQRAAIRLGQMFAIPPKSSPCLSLRISQLAQTPQASCNGTAHASHIRTNQNN
jgi:hypothetical protein